MGKIISPPWNVILLCKTIVTYQNWYAYQEMGMTGSPSTLFRMERNIISDGILKAWPNSKSDWLHHCFHGHTQDRHPGHFQKPLQCLYRMVASQHAEYKIKRVIFCVCSRHAPQAIIKKYSVPFQLSVVHTRGSMHTATLGSFPKQQ